MLGGFGLILGIAGLFGSAAASGYTSNDIKDFNALGAHQRSISEPTPEEKAIYEKWRGKTFNQRHEAFSMLASEHHGYDSGPGARRCLVRLPMAYFMSMSRPNVSLTKIGLAAPVSTTVGVVHEHCALHVPEPCRTAQNSASAA